MSGNDDSPFGDDPLGSGPVGGDAPLGGGADGGEAAESGGGGLLDDLRSEGEKVVGDEIADLQQAMAKVEHFSESFAESSVESLQAEWQEIERELKQALRSGMHAAESAHPGTSGGGDADAETLRAEVKRKNDLIGQLSDTVARLNREMDETERGLRDELRGLKDRAGSQDEELAELRKWSDELEGREGKLRTDLQAATTERDELKRTSSRATEALETEKKMQEERYAALQDELKDTNLIASEHETARKDTERKLADAERRLQSTEEARAKLEAERDGLQDAAGSDAKRATELQERVTELEADLAAQRKRSDEEIKRLRRAENRWRGDAETSRSRLGEVVGQLKAAVSLLDQLPAAPTEQDDVEPEAAPDADAAPEGEDDRD